MSEASTLRDQEMVGRVFAITEGHVSITGYAQGQLAVLLDLMDAGKITLGDIRDVVEKGIDTSV